MSNPSKQKGTNFETLIKNYLIEQGFDCAQALEFICADFKAGN